MKMDCPTLDKLSAYLERELNPEETAVVTRHLRTCPRCRQELAALKAVVQGLRELPAEEFSGEEQDRLLAVMIKAASRPRHAYRLLAGVAAAVVLAFGAGFLGSGLYQQAVPGPERAASALEAFVNEHQSYETLLSADSDLNVQVSIKQ